MKRRCEKVAVLPLVIALLFCLVFPSLVWADPAKQKVAVCHMPDSPAQKTLEIPADALSGHLAHGDLLGACEDLPPGAVPAQPGAADDVVAVCHQPGSPAQKTLEVPAKALSGHLAHGDLLGACEDLPPGGVPAQPGAADGVVTICHQPGTPAQKTMTLSVASLDGHLAHGDQPGACEDLPVSADRKVLICHKLGTPAQKTMSVPSDALNAHLDHGDALGSCEDLLGVAGCRRPVIASSGASIDTWRVRGWERPYAY